MFVGCWLWMLVDLSTKFSQFSKRGKMNENGEEKKFEKLAVEMAQLFLNREKQEEKLYIHPRVLVGIPGDKAVEVRVSLVSLAKLENRPE